MNEQIAENKTTFKKYREESCNEYLKALYVFFLQKGRGSRSCELAYHMNFTRASVSRALKVLKEEGLVTVDEAALICLTDLGRERARQVYEKHSFFEKLLVMSGVDEKVAGIEATRMEHGISSESFGKLSEYIQSAVPEFSNFEVEAI